MIIAGATRLVSAKLFGISSTDPLTIAVATVLLIAVAALAGFIPAQLASRVDPMAALRCFQFRVAFVKGLHRVTDSVVTSA